MINKSVHYDKEIIRKVERHGDTKEDEIYLHGFAIPKEYLKKNTLFEFVLNEEIFYRNRVERIFMEKDKYIEYIDKVKDVEGLEVEYMPCSNCGEKTVKCGDCGSIVGVSGLRYKDIPILQVSSVPYGKMCTNLTRWK